MKNYPGADVQSDHKPFEEEYRTKYKSILRTRQTKYDRRILKNNTIKDEVTRDINDRCRQIKEESVDVEERIKLVTETVKNIREEYLKADEVERKPWVREEILILMKERKQRKNNPTKYITIQEDIQRKIREVKQEESDGKCREIKVLQSKFDEFNVHIKVREVTGKFKMKAIGKLLDDNEELIVDREDIKDTWNKFIEQLFFDERGKPSLSIQSESGHIIMTDEVIVAINTLKEGKASGPDEVHSEFFKLIDDETVKVLTSIFNTIYDRGG